MLFAVRRALCGLMAVAMSLIIPCCVRASVARAVAVRLPAPPKGLTQEAELRLIGELPPVSGKTALVPRPRPRTQPTDGLAFDAGRAMGVLRPLRGRTERGILPFASEAARLVMRPRAP